MSILSVKNLRKKYPAFELNDVSFSLEPGKITGFIGRNGAGKSTTLNSLFNFVHPDNGEIRFFDKEFIGHEFEIKQKIGYVSSGVNYYSNKKIKSITSITKSFYDNWDTKAYCKYLALFKLDEKKTPAQLSAGMKVKYALALALSHNADLLILDEPTSGLDPVSRDDLLEVFMNLSDEGKTILFSTHITSDLDKCADNIIYIQNGQIIAETTIKAFEQSYRLVEFSNDSEVPDIEIIGKKRSKNGFSGLVKSNTPMIPGLNYSDANLEAIMVHLEKEEAL